MPGSALLRRGAGDPWCRGWVDEIVWEIDRRWVRVDLQYPAALSKLADGLIYADQKSRKIRSAG